MRVKQEDKNEFTLTIMIHDFVSCNSNNSSNGFFSKEKLLRCDHHKTFFYINQIYQCNISQKIFWSPYNRSVNIIITNILEKTEKHHPVLIFKHL